MMLKKEHLTIARCHKLLFDLVGEYIYVNSLGRFKAVIRFTKVGMRISTTVNRLNEFKFDSEEKFDSTGVELSYSLIELLKMANNYVKDDLQINLNENATEKLKMIQVIIDTSLDGDDIHLAARVEYRLMNNQDVGLSVLAKEKIQA